MKSVTRPKSGSVFRTAKVLSLEYNGENYSCNFLTQSLILHGGQKTLAGTVGLRASIFSSLQTSFAALSII